MITKSLEIPTGIVFEDDNQIHVAGPVFREGVFNGAFQEYEDFEPDIPKMIGLPYVRGEHPTDATGKNRPVLPTDPILGNLIDAKGLPDKRLAWGVWNLNKKLLTQAELDNLHAGVPIGTSPGFWCDEIKLKEPKTYIRTGEIYYKIEKGPRIFNHIASPSRPACKNCGMLHAQSEGGVCITEGGGAELNKLFPGICFNKFVVQGIWSDDELKQMIGETLNLDPMKDDVTTAYRQLLTQILLGLDAAPLKIQSEEGMDKKDLMLLVQSEEFKEAVGAATAAATAEAVKEPLEKLTKAEETIGKLSEALDTEKKNTQTLLADKTARDNAATAAATEASQAAEKSLKEKFISWLKPGKVPEAEDLWAAAKTNIWQFRIENPAHFITQAEEKTRFTPAASSKTSSGASEPELIQREDGIVVQAESGEIDWTAMGIKSPAELGAELQLKPFMPKAGA